MLVHSLRFAGRQPAVQRLLEREFAPNSRAYEVAAQLLGRDPALFDLRIDSAALTAGLAAVRLGHCDATMVRSVYDQVAEYRELTERERDAVATVIAAMIWAVFDVSSRDLAEVAV